MNNLSLLLTKNNIDFIKIGLAAEEEFVEIQSLPDSAERDLVFINQPTDASFEILESLPARMTLIEKSWGLKNQEKLGAMDKALFLVENPRLVIARLLKQLHPEENAYSEGIHPTAKVHPEADIHPTAGIGLGCLIGRCSIGAHSVIGAYSIITDNVHIGEYVHIREFCLIGGCGFGLVRNERGEAERIPQVGRVEIEDNVEVFPYVNIDRGTFGATRIGSGSKLDHYVHIGHNSTVGCDCIITARVTLCGGCRVGDSCWLGVGSIIKEKVIVGSKVTVGLGAVVTKPVADGLTVVGIPAKPLLKEDLNHD